MRSIVSGTIKGLFVAVLCVLLLSWSGNGFCAQAEDESEGQEDNRTDVFISVAEVENGPELEGAKMQIEKVTGEETIYIESWTLGEVAGETGPHKVKLSPATYVLTETLSPDYFHLPAESITFEVDDDGVVTIKGESITNNTIVVINEVTGALKISIEEEETGDKPGGIVVSWTSPAAEAKEYISNEDGVITIPYLPVGKEYSYIVTGIPDNLVVSSGGEGTVKIIKKNELTEIAVKLKKKITYTIKFIDEDGTVLSSRVYENGTAVADIEKPSVPNKEATAEYTYTFAGWTPEIANVTGDATYTATYTAKKNSYTITWKNDDGAVIDTTTVEYGAKPTHDEPTKAATSEYTYTFAGWTPEIANVTGDAIYTATYTAKKNSYTITWKNDDGTVIDITTVEYGVKPTHEAPTKVATVIYTYIFAGWTPEIAVAKGDITYTATYSEVVQNPPIFKANIPVSGNNNTIAMVSQTKSSRVPEIRGYVESVNPSGNENSSKRIVQSTSDDFLYTTYSMENEGKKIGEVYTFDLTLKVSDDNGNDWKEYKLNLERPEAEIIIQYPNGMSKDTDSKYVEILHFLQDDASEQVDFSFQNDGIHMKVSSLSPFAIIYILPEEATLPTDDTPATGDNGMVGFWMILAVLSCGVLTAAAVYDRKRRRA